MRKYRRNRNNIEEPQIVDEPEEAQTIAEALAETVDPGLSKAEFEKIRSEALEKAKTTRHEWRMKGRGILACTSCTIPHRAHVPPHLILTGIDTNGKPVFKRG